MDREYYRNYYHYEYSHWWFRARARIIESRLLSHIISGQNLKILNVGAATSASTILLEKYGEVTSVEYDRECCDFMTQTLGKEVINASITNLPLENESFDLVCAFDVIEHVEDDKTAVSELMRVCKTGGVIFITVPAFMILWSRHDVVNQHFRRYKLKNIRLLFKMYSGKTIYATYFNFLLFIPILTIRLFTKSNRRKIDDQKDHSDFTLIKINWVNKLLYRIFCFERVLLKLMRFPFGVSILWMWSKE